MFFTDDILHIFEIYFLILSVIISTLIIRYFFESKIFGAMNR